MKTLKNIGLFATLLVLFGCSSYNVSTQSMISQLKENQMIEKSLYFQ